MLICIVTWNFKSNRNFLCSVKSFYALWLYAQCVHYKLLVLFSVLFTNQCVYYHAKPQVNRGKLHACSLWTIQHQISALELIRKWSTLYSKYAYVRALTTWSVSRMYLKAPLMSDFTAAQFLHKIRLFNCRERMIHVICYCTIIKGYIELHFQAMWNLLLVSFIGNTILSIIPAYIVKTAHVFEHFQVRFQKRPKFSHCQSKRYKYCLISQNCSSLL